MKAALFLLGLLGTSSLTQANLGSPWVAGTGQFRREIYQVWVDPNERPGIKWNAERDKWPITMDQAVGLARTALTKIVGDDQRHFGLREATLRRFFSSGTADKASWYFLVVFESDHEALITRIQQSGYSPAVFPFVVFPDGSVSMPEKKKPNK